MQTDEARIVIRERTWSENLDLALQVIRTHFAPLVLAGAVMIVPLVILNTLIVFALFDVYLDLDFDAYALQTLLVMIEAPLATAAMTLYLGQAMFTLRPDVKRIRRELTASLPQLLVLQGIVRFFLIVPVLTWIVPYAIYPYLNEIILLERYPLFAPAGQLSTLRRASVLNRGGSSDYIAQAMGAGVLSLGLVLALWSSQRIVLEWLLGVSPKPLTYILTYQAALWTVAMYFTVARFLVYLDQRIRYEGWEMELALRAQRDRLSRKVA